MVKLGTSKLQCGALNSVSIGGANAHSANVVAAIFLATGQVVLKNFFIYIFIHNYSIFYRNFFFYFY